MSLLLSHLMPLHSYLAVRETVFPSEPSLRWFIRVHRQRLIAAGALFKLRGRPLIHAENFDRYVLATATSSAAQEAHDVV